MPRDTLTPIVGPDGVTINVARGIVGAAEKMLARFHPNGQKLWDGGLGEVIRKAVQQNPDIPKEDLTAVQLAERIGILKPERKRRRA
jgi:hypothetical protein